MEGGTGPAQAHGRRGILMMVEGGVRLEDPQRARGGASTDQLKGARLQ